MSTLAAELALADRRVMSQAQPGDPRLLAQRGWLHLFSGNRARAEMDFAHALRIDESEPSSLLGRALSAELTLGNDEEPYLALVEGARGRPGEPFADAAAELALSALSRTPSERSSRVQERLLGLADSPGVSAELRAEALRALAAWADPAPDSLASEALARRRGCVPAWALATHGRTPHGEVLRAAVAPQPAHARLLTTRACRALLTSPRGLPTRFVLATSVRSSREVELEVELEVSDADAWAKIWIGNIPAVVRADARRFLPARTVSRVRIPPGGSRVVLDLASPGPDVYVSVVVRDPKTGQAAPSVDFVQDPRGTQNGPKTATVLRTPAGRLPALAFPDRWFSSVLADYLTARRALAWGDFDAAEGALERIGSVAPRFTSALSLAAEVELAAPARPYRHARDRVRRVWKDILAMDPMANRARLALAELALSDGAGEDVKTALTLLGEISPPRQAHGQVAVLHARALAEKGLYERAEAVLADASLPPCAVASARLQAIKVRGPLGERRKAAARLAACDGDDPSLAEVALEEGDAEVAVGERDRLLRRAPSDAGRWHDAAHAYAAVGQVEKAQALLEQALELDPHMLRSWTALADLQAREGRKADARQTLERGLRVLPEARSLVGALVALGGRDPVDRWRLDGRAVIAAFEAAERRGAQEPYGTPAVLVLDRAVVFVFTDGTRWTLTHTITKLLEKSGLDRFGEVSVREGAEVLVVRTVKADGSTREPENLGKEGITAPDLAVGDYLEVETLTFDPPLPFSEGFLGDRFFFSTFEAPLDRTEFVVVAPPGLAIDWDVRGDAPSPVISIGPAGEQVTTFAARGRPARALEPASPPHVEHVSSVTPFRKIDLPSWGEWVAQLVFRSRRGDRALRLAARQITKEASSPEAKVRAILRFVSTRVQPPGNLADEPSLVLARQSGHRTLLALALCEASGLAVNLWLARPRTSGEGVPAPVFVHELAYPLLSVDMGARRVFLDPSQDAAPFGYLSPDLRGAPVLLVPDPLGIPETPTLSRVPRDPPQADEQRIELQVTLDQDGKADMAMTQRLAGSAAVAFRHYLKDLPKDELPRDLEQQALGVHFPGVTVTSVTVDSLADPEKPLTLTLRFQVPRFARKTADGNLEVPSSPLLLRVARRYVTVASRTTPLVLAPEEATHIVMHVRVPDSFVLAQGVPAPLSLSAPANAGEFRHVVRAVSGGFTATIDSAFLPFARISPADYERFVRFAAAVDAAEARVVLLQAK